MQEVTEGLSEDFSDLDQQLHQGLIKPQVLHCDGNMPCYQAIDLGQMAQHVACCASCLEHRCLSSSLLCKFRSGIQLLSQSVW